MKYLFWIAAGYFSGSVLYAVVLPKLFGKEDICSLSDDGNPGTANVFKYGGIPLGIAVLILELAKGFVPVFFAGYVVDRGRLLFLAVMAAPVFGHAFPVFRRGKGGKCIAVSFGVLMGLFPEIRPLLLLIIFYLLFSLVIVIRSHFYRSVVTFTLFAAGCFFWMGNIVTAWGCAVISLLVTSRHFAAGREEKFSMEVRKTLKNKDI